MVTDWLVFRYFLLTSFKKGLGVMFMPVISAVQEVEMEEPHLQVGEILSQNKTKQAGMLVHTGGPSYSGGRDRMTEVYG
jgi:hypothetical protein